MTGAGAGSGRPGTIITRLLNQVCLILDFQGHSWEHTEAWLSSWILTTTVPPAFLWASQPLQPLFCTSGPHTMQLTGSR